MNAPRLAVVAPVAIWSSNDVPLPLHFRSTGSVLLASGDSRAIGSLNTAARLWTGPVALGLTDGGVLPVSASVWSVLLAASSVNDRFACRVPAAFGLNATVTVRVAPGASVVPSMPVPEIVKSPGLRPAR